MMAFNFPKDEDLYCDLKKILERSVAMREYHQALIDLAYVAFHSGKEPEDPSLLETPEYKKMLSIGEMINDKGYDDDDCMDESKFGVGSLLKREELSSLLSAKHRYLHFEKYVFSNHYDIGFFPDDNIAHPLHGTDQIRYFSQMDRHFKFMQGIGRMGEVLSKAKKHLDVIGKPEQIAKNPKNNTAAPESSFSVALYFLLLGAVLVLAGGGGLLMIPGFLTRLFNSSLIARLILYIPVAVTGLFVMGMSKEITGEDGGGYSLPMKLIGNGIVAIVVVIGSFLTLLSSFMMGEVSLEFMLLGVYYLLYGVCIMMDDAIRTSKAKEARAKLEQEITQAEKEANLVKPEFRKLVEENIGYMHRYIRFHVLWWQSLYPGKSLPSGITSLQKSFDHLLTMYDKCK